MSLYRLVLWSTQQLPRWNWELQYIVTVHYFQEVKSPPFLQAIEFTSELDQMNGMRNTVNVAKKKKHVSHNRVFVLVKTLYLEAI